MGAPQDLGGVCSLRFLPAPACLENGVVPMEEYGPEEWETAFSQLPWRISSAVTLPDPLPAVLRTKGGDVPLLVLAVTLNGDALVLDRLGGLNWTSMKALTVKIPPASPMRLLFGWAAKGPPGYPDHYAVDDEVS